MALHTLVRRAARNSEDVAIILRKTLARPNSKKAPLSVDSWLRVSSIGRVCPREEVLRAWGSVWKEDPISPDLGLVFEIGHGLHWMFQNKVFAKQTIGSWRCTWCGETYGSWTEGLVARPDTCIRCGAIAGGEPRLDGRPDKTVHSDAFLYVEQWLHDNEFRIGGHPDGYLVDGDINNFTDEDVIVAEYKTASTRSFYKYKKAPDFVHVVQSQCYMWLTGFRRAKIIYIDKGTFGLSSIKQHDLNYDPEMIDRVKDAILSIRSGIAGGELPERTVCSTDDCERALSCVVADKCFTT